MFTVHGAKAVYGPRVQGRNLFDCTFFCIHVARRGVVLSLLLGGAFAHVYNSRTLLICLVPRSVYWAANLINKAHAQSKSRRGWLNCGRRNCLLKIALGGILPARSAARRVRDIPRCNRMTVTSLLDFPFYNSILNLDPWIYKKNSYAR